MRRRLSLPNTPEQQLPTCTSGRFFLGRFRQSFGFIRQALLKAPAVFDTWTPLEHGKPLSQQACDDLIPPDRSRRSVARLKVKKRPGLIPAFCASQLTMVRGF